MVAYLRAQSAGVHGATGEYRSGWFYQVWPKALVVGNHADHALYVEKGRRPGKRPPMSAIQRWMAAKGIPSRAAFPIARAIGKRGIKGRPCFLKADVQQHIKRILKDELVAWSTQTLKGGG